MPENNIITITSVRVALLLYALAVGLMLFGFRGNRWRHLLRTLWTLSCLTFLCHVGAAFHYSHQWSHQDAVRSTAQQTKELMGQAFGEGIYFSYLFLVIWTADVIWWWANPNVYESRAKWISRSIHGYLFFIIFNGAVVFESGITRFGGIVAGTMFLLILAWRRVPGRNNPATG